VKTQLSCFVDWAIHHDGIRSRRWTSACQLRGGLRKVIFDDLHLLNLRQLGPRLVVWILLAKGLEELLLVHAFDHVGIRLILN